MKYMEYKMLLNSIDSRINALRRTLDSGVKPAPFVENDHPLSRRSDLESPKVDQGQSLALKK
jgi:hypothetical protein